MVFINHPQTILIALAFLVVFLIILYFVIKASKKDRVKQQQDLLDWIPAFKEFSDKWGLSMKDHEGGTLTFSNLIGKINEKEFEVFITEREVDDGDENFPGSTTTYYTTHIKIEAKEKRVNFVIKPEIFIDRIAQKLGKKDIEFGRKDLDKKFKFSSDYEEEFRKYFTIKLQDKLVGLQNEISGSISHHANHIIYERSGLINTAEELDKIDKVMVLLDMLAEAEIKKSSY